MNFEFGDDEIYIFVENKNARQGLNGQEVDWVCYQSQSCWDKVDDVRVINGITLKLLECWKKNLFVIQLHFHLEQDAQKVH